MAYLSLCLALVAGLFVFVDSAPVIQDELTGLLERHVRGFNNQAGFNSFGGGFNGGFNGPQNTDPFFNNQQPQFQPQNQNLRTEIADSINVQKPNLNHNIGATSSTSIGNSAVITNPSGLNQGGPNLKLGQGLSMAISIQGPEGPATSDTFNNAAMFNTGPSDVGQTFANGGNTSPNSNTANTGVNIQLQGNPNQQGTASTFNKANVNMFNVRGGNGGQTGTAQSFGGANGR